MSIIERTQHDKRSEELFIEIGKKRKKKSEEPRSKKSVEERSQFSSIFCIIGLRFSLHFLRSASKVISQFRVGVFSCLGSLSHQLEKWVACNLLSRRSFIGSEMSGIIHWRTWHPKR